LGQARRELEAKDVGLVLVGPGDVGQAAWLAKLIRAPFPVAADPVRAVYEAFGLVRGALGLQQTGTFLIDRDGILRLARRATNPIAALDLGELREAVAALGAPATPA
jgi:peroxiredoxin